MLLHVARAVVGGSVWLLGGAAVTDCAAWRRRCCVASKFPALSSAETCWRVNTLRVNTLHLVRRVPYHCMGVENHDNAVAVVH